ncbi:unnamed protein product [Caenorhabditis brenneri]
MESSQILLLFFLISSPLLLVMCKPKGKDGSRKVDKSRATVDARSRGKKKKSSETAIEIKPVKTPESKKTAVKEQVTQETPSKEPTTNAAKTNTKKKSASKSQERTVTKTVGTTEEYNTKDEVTAPDTSEKKNKTDCKTAEEKALSTQRTQDGSVETTKKKRKPKTEEYLDSQGDDDTLRCVKSICN